MRRPADLVLDVDASQERDIHELELSPRSQRSSFTNIRSPSEIHLSESTLNVLEHVSTPQQPASKPSIGLLFSLLPRRDLLLFVLPAIASSMIAGGIAPFMTLVIGQNFQAFANFPLTPNPPESAKHKLLHDVGIAALELLGLGIGALAMTSLTSCLWVWTGERNVLALRKRVYASVLAKDMVWFDTKMGSEGTVQSADGEGQGALGAGGLMAKFTRETDDVRQATSLSAGYLVQYLTTLITCLVLAFVRSWQLTLVTLSAIPLLMLIQGISQGVVGPMLAAEREETARAASLVDRATAAVGAVKAHNAQAHEARRLAAALDSLARAAARCNTAWAVSGGMSQFVAMAMFVQSFWFGSTLVRAGRASAGDVMSVFWACLIATSNLQMCIPQLVTLAKGKFAMAALVALVEDTASPAPAPAARHSTHSLSLKRKRPTHALRKIVPASCAGELSMVGVTFAYPARPAQAVLSEVSMYFPAGETTFIVGGSGSGKSTIAALLLRMYEPARGSVRIDEQDMAFLDARWTRAHVAAVSQAPIVCDMTVHENVALGLAAPGSARQPEEATREEVEEACTMALLGGFVRDLPEGYETRLGNGGANLSGGQKQRLAIARARLRDPSVLILDEATSALDATSRILVFEAIKRWRQNKTTIVITHDLSQITEDDFVYVLKDGCLVEQGYRVDLERVAGEFASLLESQNATGGFIPRAEEEEAPAALDQEEDEDLEEEEDVTPIKHHSVFPGRPLTMSNWMFDVVADLTGKRAPTPALVVHAPPDAITPPPLRRRRSSLTIASPTEAYFPSAPLTRRYSLQFSPTSSHFPSLTDKPSFAEDDYAFDAEKAAMESSTSEVNRRREHDLPEQRVRRKWSAQEIEQLSALKVAKTDAEKETARDAALDAEQRAQVGFWRLLREVYPTLPHKPLVFLGLCACLLSGAMTPVFSFVLSKLMVEVSLGAADVARINVLGAAVLALAAVDGLAMGAKFALMEGTALAWVTRLRARCFRRVLAQDKAWFDRTENAPARLVQVLVKDGDDARNLLATVVGQGFVVTAMLGVGLVWALVTGWQFTLVGFAIAPVFATCMTVQAKLVSKCELRNKRAREEVAKVYYDAISNIRGIRAMAFESVFQDQFETAASRALQTGVRGAFVEGCSFGVASALIYLAEALLFYVGAILIAKGTYTYLQMVETLNLVVFSVSIGSQLMAFTNRIAKSTQATRDFNRLLRLPTNTDESRGVLRPPIMGTVAFKGVSFSYPERPDVPVLNEINLELRDSECVAVVGASGCGKSTIAALLQRLYEPASGAIFIGPHELSAIDVVHLRDHVSVVSQSANLFDASVADNIAYGNTSLTAADIRRAAEAAHVHDFILGLPQGYDTPVGENATLISGGQAQRIQIARALARPARVLILDECTSALDAENQRAVLETVRHARVGRTTLMITHKLPVMKMCDRIVVVHEGRVVEEGTYEQLVQQHGVFAQLASGGEWDA